MPRARRGLRVRRRASLPGHWAQPWVLALASVLALVSVLALTACGPDTSTPPAAVDADETDAVGADADIVEDAARDADADAVAEADGGTTFAWPAWSQPDGPHVVEDYARAVRGDFWAAPWPADRRRDADGRDPLAGFPNPARTPLVEQLVEIGRGLDGYGVSSGVFVPVSAALDPASLPGVAESRAPGASGFVLDVDPRSTTPGARHPVRLTYRAAVGDFDAPHALVALPVQGAPLRAGWRYALVVSTQVRTADGAPLAPSALVSAVAAAGDAALAPDAAAWRAAIDNSELPTDQIAAVVPFTTHDPTAGLHAAWAAREPDAVVLDAPFACTETFDRYCVFSTTATIRNFQHGQPPFLEEGGAWRLDEGGVPVEAERMPTRLFVTRPTGEAPDAGFPAVLFVRTGGGGDRPLIDRGVRPMPGGGAPVGSGLADDFAQVGWAGVQIDGPHGGPRNVSRGDEQFLMFNINNPLALRDNVRESAIELALLLEELPALLRDLPDCDGIPHTGDAIDADRLVLFGHSMGATIAPLVAAVSPRLTGLLLSGAGGSWIENVVHKQLPLPTRPIAEALLGYRPGTLDVYDPVLSLLQWVGEPADPQVYAHEVVRARRDDAPGPHTLMIQGIADTYILPSIANALSLPLGLQLAGDAIEDTQAESAAFEPLLDTAASLGIDAGPLAFPVSGNVAGESGTHTAVVVQRPEDGIEDGHEVVFQREDAQATLRCFLATLGDGLPVVVGPGDTCPR
jgi:predicted small lipoprotein YifL